MKVNRHALRWVLLFTLIVASSFIPLIESKSANLAANEQQSAPLLLTDRPLAGALGEQQTPGIALLTTSGVAQSDNDETDCEHLPRDNPLRRLELNGPRLPLRYNSLEKGSENRLLFESKVLPFSDGRILAGLGGTLHMLDGGRQVEWTYTPSWMFWDFEKLFVSSPEGTPNEAYDKLAYNVRTRAFFEALRRGLLNSDEIEKAASELESWIERDRRKFANES